MLASGMIFQIDIIPAVPGYAGVSAESTVALADAGLREQIAHEYPQLWARINARRTYLKDELGIQVGEDVLPLCSTVGYLRPYLLDHSCALAVRACGASERVQR